MCGIFGFVGQTKSINTLVKGLKSLEYRGYDSAGLAYIQDKRVNVIKSTGTVENLNLKLDSNTVFNIGIAHTRWATHGKPSAINAHPHVSFNNHFAIVHNGIIENYSALKNKYLSDVTFSSSTDSEIIAHLLEKFYCGDMLKTLKHVCALLDGSYALAVISTYSPKKIYLAKKNSPLMFGASNDGYYFSSDVNTLSLFCKQFYIMEENEITCLTKQNSFSYDITLKPLIKQPHNALQDGQNNQIVTCYMKKEIAESKMALTNTASHFWQQFSTIPSEFFSDVDLIYLIGCGTAYHSCLIGKSYLQNAFNIPIMCEIASEFIYSTNPISNRTLCIFVSQSGETADTILALKLAASRGAKTLAITNNKSSTIVFESQYYLSIHAGWEKAVASTKAYVCQLAMFYLLSYSIQGEFSAAEKNVLRLADVIDNFNCDNWVDSLVKLIVQFDKIIFIGRKNSYTTALEASLKLKEITYINSIAVASGELKHGTLALVDERSLIIAALCESELESKNLNSLKEIKARGGQTVILSQSQDLCAFDSPNLNLLLPNCDEALLPILAIIPLQKLACALCVSLGFNPDKPKNLSKSVTVE